VLEVGNAQGNSDAVLVLGQAREISDSVTCVCECVLGKAAGNLDSVLVQGSVGKLGSRAAGGKRPQEI